MAYHIANEAPQVFEGQAIEEKPIATQTPEPEPQGTEKVEDNAAPKVEGVESPVPSSGEQPRPKKASYYSNERAKTRKLEDELSSLKLMVQQALEAKNTQAPALPPAPVPASPGNEEEFWKDFNNDPRGTLKKLLSEVKPDILNSVTESMKKDQARNTFLQKEREADEVVRTSEFAESNSNFEKELIGIMSDYGLTAHYNVDPKLAVESAIRIYRLSHPKPEKPFAGSAPTKAQMQTVVSGRPPSADSEAGVIVELQNLMTQLQRDPTLTNDPDWNAKWEKAKSMAKDA